MKTDCFYLNEILPIVWCMFLSIKTKKYIVKTSLSLFQHVCVYIVYHQYMRDKKCQLSFECENAITLLSRSGCINILIIIIISLLTSHRLLSSTHHIRYILVWFWSRFPFLSAVAPRTLCLLVLYVYVCVCVCSRSFPPFSMVLFCLIAIEWRRMVVVVLLVMVVVVVHAYIVVIVVFFFF